jgi:type I restriction enzyme R subunit
MILQEMFRRRDLPHWDVPGATFFITACLADSIPARGMHDLQAYAAELRAQKCPPTTPRPAWEARTWKLLFARADHWLDHEPAARHLRDPALAGLVRDALLHFAGRRCDVYAFVVMPSHFHWVFRPRDEWVASLVGPRSPRERILHSVKGYSARRCNRHRNCVGAFWQEESYDHWSRDPDEVERIVHSVENNPVQAGLVASPEAWPFSSARWRREQGGTWGEPLLPAAE